MINANLLQQIQDRDLEGEFAEYVLTDIRDQIEAISQEEFLIFYNLINQASKEKHNKYLTISLLEFMLGIPSIDEYITTFLQEHESV